MEQPRIELVPAIIPKSLEEIASKVEKVAGLAQFVQIDITDGVFAGERSWPLTPNAKDELTNIVSEEEGMPYWDKVEYELDLMIAPENMNLELFMKLGPSRIILHAKKKEEFENYLKEIPRMLVQIGIAFDITDHFESMISLIEQADFVQCMGISKIGFQGAPFDTKVIENIKKIKEVLPFKKISVDGGVNAESMRSLIEAGADRLVAGSAIFNTSDPSRAYEELSQMLY